MLVQLCCSGVGEELAEVEGEEINSPGAVIEVGEGEIELVSERGGGGEEVMEDLSALAAEEREDVAFPCKMPAICAKSELERRPFVDWLLLLDCKSASKLEPAVLCRNCSKEMAIVFRSSRD